jgi:phosphoglycerate dehydrogenase-like enzyme
MRIGVGSKGKVMTVRTIGLIGAGHIESQLARLAVRHGYHVVVSNSTGAGILQRQFGQRGREHADRCPTVRNAAGR